ncbi:MAG: peptide chain release factor N(5)-glutamine methyltransferase [Ignavibacteriaceae bacterium]
MLTVLDAINLSADYLKKKNIESPRINAEHLLSHVLKRKRLELYLSFDKPLNEDETNLYRELIRRRGTSEPLQYILGSVEFYGLEFRVTRDVLIPRPETEILVEKIIESFDKNSQLKILDIGTGSGNIAISLAKNFNNAEVKGIDVSGEALTIAKENSRLNDVNGNVKFGILDVLNQNITSEVKYDVIVSNPPYVSVKEYPDLRPELNVYEPRIALTDENDGLNFYRAISEKSKNILKKDGQIFFEIGQGQCEEIKNILERNKFSDIKIFKDYSDIERVITGVLN